MANNSLLGILILVVIAGGSIAGYVSYQDGFDAYLAELHWTGRNTNWGVTKAQYDKFSLLLDIRISYVSFQELKSYAIRYSPSLYCDKEAQIIWAYRDVSPGMVDVRVYRHNDINSVVAYIENLVKNFG